MKQKRFKQKALSLVLCASMVASSFTGFTMNSNTKNVQAFSAGTTIDEEKRLTEADIPNTTLLTVLKVIGNYTKAYNNGDVTKPLTGDEDFLSSAYDHYKDDSITFGELKAYTGAINLNRYASKITDIKGLGYARGASSFNLGSCTSITSIPEDEFGKCSMTEIVLPNTIKKFGKGAFQQCINLKKVLINGKTYASNENIADIAGIDSIGDFAFDGCKALTTVNLSTSENLYIGKSAFSNCVSLTGIVLPMSNANNLGDSAFAGCTSLMEITFNDNLNYIPSNCFNATRTFRIMLIGKTYSNKNVMPSGLTYVGASAFQDCVLSSMDFSNSKKLTYFGEYSFSAAKLGNLILPPALNKISSRAFNATIITSPLVIPDSVTTIEDGAFIEALLKGITLSANLTTINDSVFSGCYFAENNFKINAPSKLKKIGNKAFYKSYGLTNTDFIKDINSLTEIGDYAFAGCSQTETDQIEGKYKKDIYGSWIYEGLTDVKLPNSVTTLGKNIFMNDYSLETVNLGSGVTEIPENAFKMDQIAYSSLKKVILPENVTKINAYAFANNGKLRTVGYTNGSKITETPGVAQFGNKLIYIGNQAFASCGASYTLKNAYYNGYSPKAVTKKLLPEYIHEQRQEGDETYLIYVAGYSNMKIAYINPSDLENSLPPEDDRYFDQLDVSLVAKKVWAKSDNYTIRHEPISKELDSEGNAVPTPDPSTVTEVFTFDESNSGYNNTPTDIVKIIGDPSILSSTPVAGKKSFYKLCAGTGAYRLEGSTIYPTIYTGLEKVILPDSMIDTIAEDGEITSLGEETFKNCISLKSFTFSKNNLVIPIGTFNGCGVKLTDWASNKTINNTYFGLESIERTTQIVRIKDNAFYNCYNLKLKEGTTGGEISDKLEDIGSYAFFGCKNITSIVFHSALKTIGNAAFKECAETSNDNKITYVSSDGKERSYSYKSVKGKAEAGGLGLESIDFTYANKIESIGSEAFSYTRLEVVNLPNAKYDTIPNNLFTGCTYLNTVTIPDNVTKIGQKAFSDCQSLVKVHMPATATIDKSILQGATPGTIAGLLLQVSTEDANVTIPTDQEYTLPINCFTPNTRSATSAYTITVFDDANDTKGTVIYGDNAPVSGTKYDGILSAKIEFPEKNDGNDIIKLVAGSTLKKNLIVKVQTNSSFEKFSDSSYAIINAQTLTYNVSIDKVPVASIDLSCLSSNAALTSETNAAGDKVDALYMASGTSPVSIKASLNPVNTSDTCSWSIADSNIATIEETAVSQGESTLTVTPVKTGSTKITLTCGKLTKDINVYVKVPVTNFQASTGISSPTSSADAISIALGTTEQITVSSSYDKKYSDNDWKLNGDTILFASSDEKIARVDANGLITPVAEGQCLITVRALASCKIITYTVTVTPSGTVSEIVGKNIASIEGAADVYTNGTLALKAVLNPVKAINGVNWYIDKGIGSIDKTTGLFTAGATPGEVIVKAVMLDVGGNETSQTKTVSFKVLQAATAVSLTTAMNNVTMTTGNSVTISKTSSNSKKGYYLTPTTSTDKVSVASNNPSIATATLSGDSITVKGIAAGVAAITITAASGVSASFNVTVIEAIKTLSLPKEMNLNIGTSAQLTPVYTPATSNESFTWKTNDSKIATVSATGVVTAIGKGNATITVKSTTGKTASITIHVKVPAKKVAIKTSTNAKTIYIAKGTSKSITTVLSPTDSTDDIKYTSSKKKVVSISGSGSSAVIKAKKVGTAKITAKASSGKKAVVTVKVVKKAIPAKKVKISGKKKVKVKKTIQLTAKLTKKKSTDSVTWSSSNTAVATVDSYGLVTGVKKGKVKITCTAASGKKKAIKIKVSK